MQSTSERRNGVDGHGHVSTQCLDPASEKAGCGVVHSCSEARRHIDLTYIHVQSIHVSERKESVNESTHLPIVGMLLSACLRVLPRKPEGTFQSPPCRLQCMHAPGKACEICSHTLWQVRTCPLLACSSLYSCECCPEGRKVSRTFLKSSMPTVREALSMKYMSSLQIRALLSTV